MHSLKWQGSVKQVEAQLRGSKPGIHLGRSALAERERESERELGVRLRMPSTLREASSTSRGATRKPPLTICHFFQPLLMLQTTGEGWLNQGGDSSVLVWLLSRPFSCCAANFASKWGMGLLVLAGGHNQPSANLLPRELTLLSLLGFSSFVKLCHSICSEDILRGQGASF